MLWYFGMDKGVGAIISMEGGTQGCVGGGTISMGRMTSVPNSRTYDDGDILRWHADDIFCHSRHGSSHDGAGYQPHYRD
jgi:hypothetical protein